MLLGGDILVGKFLFYCVISLVSIMSLSMSFKYGLETDKNILITALWLVLGLILWTRVYVFMFSNDVILYLSFHVIVTIYVLIFTTILKIKGE